MHRIAETVAKAAGFIVPSLTAGTNIDGNVCRVHASECRNKEIIENSAARLEIIEPVVTFTARKRTRPTREG
jgi:hypothetical protein